MIRTLWSKMKWHLVCTVAGVIIGLAMGWWILHQKPAQETYKPAIKQADGSVVLEKKPDPSAKPAQQVPKGAVVERIVYVTVAPPSHPPEEATTTIPGSNETANLQTLSVVPSQHKIRVDLTLIRMPDGSRRVVASSPDGAVDGADMPVESAEPVKEVRNAIGLRAHMASDGTRAWGPTYDRDFGFLRAGVDVSRIHYNCIAKTEWAVGVRALIRF